MTVEMLIVINFHYVLNILICTSSFYIKNFWYMYNVHNGDTFNTNNIYVCVQVKILTVIYMFHYMITKLTCNKFLCCDNLHIL